MAGRAPCSASGSSDEDSLRHLLELSHDELSVIVDGLADPLQPVVAVALSTTCKGLRTPLGAALELLQQRHKAAVALCRKLRTPLGPMSCALLRDAKWVLSDGAALTADDMATLGMILTTTGLPRLEDLNLSRNKFGDEGMQALCVGLGRAGAAPSLRRLTLYFVNFGPAGAEALATAFCRGAMPKLDHLDLNYNPIGNQGLDALAMPLRMLPALKTMMLVQCDIGDDGVASLVVNLGNNDFKELATLWLDCNNISYAGLNSVHAAVDHGMMPALKDTSGTNRWTCAPPAGGGIPPAIFVAMKRQALMSYYLGEAAATQSAATTSAREEAAAAAAL